MSYFSMPQPSSPNNSAIKQKFEYNDYGEFVPKMQQSQVIMQGRQQAVQQPDSFRVMNADKQSINNYNSNIFSDPRKNKWTSTGDKPTQVTYDSSNYQRQAQQLYGPKNNNRNYNSSAQLSSAATQLYTAGGNNPSQQSNNNNNNSLQFASPFQRASQTLLQPESLPQQRQKYGSFHEHSYHQNPPPSLYIPPRIPGNNQNSSPLKRQREERAFQEELALQKNNNESQLYNKQLYNQLRYGYNNKNIRTHFEIAGAPKDTLQLGDGQNHFDAKPSLLINEAQFRRSVEKLLAKKMNNDRVRSPMNRVHGNSLKILERENRQYNLSEGDAVEQMMAVSSKLRNLKEYLLRIKDPMKISSLRQSIEKRVLAKSIQEDRKKRLVALLGLDVYSSPQRQNNNTSSNSSIRSSYGRMQ